MRFFKWLIALFWLIAFNALAISTSLPAKDELNALPSKPVLRVGVHSIPRLPYWSGDVLLPAGIVHDFSVLISKELNAPIKYIQYNSISEVLEGITIGEVDIAIGYAKTNLREERFIFTDPILNVNRVALIKNNKLKEDLSKLRWACIADTVSCDYLFDLGYENVIEFKRGNFYTEEILNPEIDAIIDNYDSVKIFLSNHQDDNINFTIDYNFKPYQISILLHKKNKNLQDELNSLINKWLYQGDIGDISKKYNLNYELLKEIDSTNTNITFKYSIKENIFPYFYWDENEERYSGYIYELLEKISNRTPIKFEFVPSNGRDIESMLVSGLVDILPMYNADSVDLNKFSSTKVYTNSKYVLMRSDVSATDAIGILDRANIFRANEDTGNFVVYSNINDMLESVKNGTVSSVYVNDILAESIVLNNDDNEFEIIEKSKNKKISVPLSMIVSSSKENSLTLINNALSTLSNRELTSLWRNYNRVDYNFGYDRQLVVIYSFIFVLIVFVFSLAFYRTYKKMSEKLERYYTNLVVSQGRVEWLGNVIDTIPYMVCIRDKDETILLTNKKYKEIASMSGYQDEDALLYNLLSEVDADISSEYWQIIEVKDKKSHLFGQHYEIINKIVRSPSNTNVFVLTFFNDVTTAKEKELNLIESQRIATQLAEQKSQFVAVVSHELRTPISAILGFIEILNQDYNRPDRDMIFTNALYSVNRLKQLVDDILDFSKLEANQLSISLVKSNLLLELCPVIRSFELLAKNKGVKFQFNWKPTPYVVAKIDYLRLIQIINNILSNAIKFTDNGMISVEVENDDQQLKIRFRDTGIGMSDNQLSTLFDPFVQAEDSISRTYGGTGLGMAIVLNLVKLMGGEIKVHSSLGIGTRIIISIPIMASKFDCSEIPVSLCNKVTHPGIADWYDALGLPYKFEDEYFDDLSIMYPDLIEIFKNSKTSDIAYDVYNKALNGHVLVIDDDAINRLLLKKQLEEFGITTTLASTGLEAFDILCNMPQERYDLIITDCHMPILNGFGLTEKIRSMQGNISNIPIIGCTADNSLKTSKRSRSVGMNSMLYKPYTLAELYSALKNYIYLESDLDENFSYDNWKFNIDSAHQTEMANAVIESFQETLYSLKKDNPDIKSIVHKVKGAASILKHDSLVELCGKLEKKPSDHSLTVMLCTMLEQVIADVKQHSDNK